MKWIKQCPEQTGPKHIDYRLFTHKQQINFACEVFCAMFEITYLKYIKLKQLFCNWNILFSIIIFLHLQLSEYKLHFALNIVVVSLYYELIHKNETTEQLADHTYPSTYSSVAKSVGIFAPKAVIQ